MTDLEPPAAAALYLRHALRSMARGRLLAVREDISNALRLLEAGAHTPVNPCPRCESSTTYLTGEDFMCVTCGNVWNPFTQAVDKGMADNDARPGGATSTQLRSIAAAFALAGIGDNPSRLIMASASANRPLHDLSELSYDEAGDLAEALVNRVRTR